MCPPASLLGPQLPAAFPPPARLSMLTRPAAAATAACRQCSRMHTLALQSAMFDQETTLERLAACTTIEVRPYCAGQQRLGSSGWAAAAWQQRLGSSGWLGCCRCSSNSGGGNSGGGGGSSSSSSSSGGTVILISPLLLRHNNLLLRPASWLQHLDLSNCCLTRVPSVLARLPRLTNLTLNENDALGASAAALAPLSALTNLRVGGWVGGWVVAAGPSAAALPRFPAAACRPEQSRVAGALVGSRIKAEHCCACLLPACRCLRCVSAASLQYLPGGACTAAAAAGCPCCICWLLVGIGG